MSPALLQPLPVPPPPPPLRLAPPLTHCWCRRQTILALAANQAKRCISSPHVQVVDALRMVLKLASERLNYAFEPFDWQ